MFCPYCNKVLDEESTYCKHCGAKVKGKSRHIPAEVKREVWKRDKGRCVNCGGKEDVEYDHIIPFSKGGSNTATNIQILCKRCNLEKKDQIGI
ncbi:MAG: HNH endonuclease [Promethearchaeota archaeon]